MDLILYAIPFMFSFKLKDSICIDLLDIFYILILYFEIGDFFKVDDFCKNRPLKRLKFVHYLSLLLMHSRLK